MTSSAQLAMKVYSVLPWSTRVRLEATALPPSVQPSKTKPAVGLVTTPSKMFTVPEVALLAKVMTFCARLTVPWASLALS